jgi:hypothetical protein
MERRIIIKITKAGPNVGPFSISDQFGNIIDQDVSKFSLIRGMTYMVDESVNTIVLESFGKCYFKKTFSISSYSIVDFANATYSEVVTGCLWRHHTDIHNYNLFYGNIEPYIIEYPFAYQYNDEILQNVQDYTKAYQYLTSSEGVFNDNTRIEVDDKWFNKAVLYNGQQSSGILELVPKPKNNLQAYGTYPVFNTDSKVITYTKSDNFYQYNTFWALNKSPYVPLFKTSCNSLSLDKEVNQDNMDYSYRSFSKAPLRAKELKVRHILDNTSTVHLVSQFILTPAQISYK